MAMLRLLRSVGRLVGRGRWQQGARAVVSSPGRGIAAQQVATKETLEAEFPVGKEVSGFVVREMQEVAELHLTALRLQHQATGADYLHIARADPNNVFCVGFRTTPMDSTGVPHILEHTVLCGSEKFPCRDPFFKMLNRSLSTFMNAMTGCDFTIYPFSTQHPVDFRNLMSVYLDAVFKPNLSELDFLQEGWRLEHQDFKDPSSPIVFKGVVFNEMKGVFADSQRLFMQKLLNGILPSHTYGVVSGGDPLVIPQLTWEQLKEFHAYHYHPSNAHFFTYGDQPLVNHLQFIHNNYLKHYSRIDPNTEVPEEPSWQEPRSAHVACGVDPMGSGEAQASVAVSYKLVDITNTFETFVLAILAELLTSGPNASFYKALLEPGLGSSFSPSSGFEGSTRSTTFTVGLQGVKEQDVDQVRAIIEETFDHVIEEGFPAERVESVLHNIELAMKHQTSSFGLSLAMNLTPLWNLGGNPIDGLLINSKITKFRKCLEENPKFLQEKVRQYFKENFHKYTLTMAPQDSYEDNLHTLEEAQLKERVDALTSEDQAKIWELGNTLASKQEEEEDLSSLPTLQVSDIPRTVVPVPTTTLTVGGVEVQVCDCPTNDLTYFTTVLSTKDVAEELRPLVPLLCGVLTRMGAGNMDFRQLDQASELVSGGLHTSPHTCFHPVDATQYEQGIVLSSHCLNSNVQKMLDLWRCIFNEAKFDDLQRFSTLVSMIATDQANSLVYSGHQYAISVAASSTSHVSSLAESWGGLSQLRRMKSLSESKDLTATLESLRVLARQLLSRQGMRVAINTTPGHHDATLHTLESFLGELDGTPDSNRLPLATIPQTFSPHTKRTHCVFPFPINFAAKAFPGVPYAHPDAGALRVLARVMFRFLHREIREKGGAYGGGAKANPGGAFTFYSYRDPHSTQTLAAFDAAVEWVLSGGFNERDVAEAKLGVFQAVDAPVSPGALGKRRFLSHITDQLFSDHRQQVLDAAPQDLVRVARMYLKDAHVEGTCLIGPQNDDLEDHPFWNTVQG